MAFAKGGPPSLITSQVLTLRPGDPGCNLTLGPGVCLRVTRLTKKYQPMRCKQAVPKHVIAFNSFKPHSGTSTGATTSVHACPVLRDVLLSVQSSRKVATDTPRAPADVPRAGITVHALRLSFGQASLLHLVENGAEGVCDLQSHFACLPPLSQSWC